MDIYRIVGSWEGIFMNSGSSCGLVFGVCLHSYTLGSPGVPRFLFASLDTDLSQLQELCGVHSSGL